ncbi:large subunit ribosomal protein L22 [Catalinimonas alkaloidigena]|uniref:50S ribosomal protein L22 n=2 Tax=Catalinimonas alkaloidigena TaxID=1075417 RepID=A0A1G9Q764_9BACT|nr:large subunit ribosomal protein L22 [Catalinimonas alkaloidigena]
MRLLADLVRGKRVDHALNILKVQSRYGADQLYKLVRSAVANWEEKNPEGRPEEMGLYIKTIQVDGGRMLKRLQPAPQGRAHRIRKRSNHITLVVDSKVAVEVEEADVNNESESAN